MYVMFDSNFPVMRLVKSELRLHEVVENHTYIENQLLSKKKLCRIPVSIYFLVVIVEQWSILSSDNIFAAFFIEQSDLVSCEDGFATKACKIMFHSLREEVYARRNL